MSMPELQRRVDEEPKGKVQITFSGRIHSPFNLQGVDNSISEIATHFEQSKGKGILLLENAQGTPSSAENVRRKSSVYGGYANVIVATILQDESKTIPTLEMVEYRRAQIDEGGFDSVVSRRLLPPVFLAEYYLFRGIDQLRKVYGFDIEHESLNATSVNRVKSLLSQEGSLSWQANEYFKHGDFDKAAAVNRAKLASLRELGELRDAAVANNMRRRIDEMLRAHSGGSLFILFGSTHSGIPDKVIQKIGYSNQVRISIHLGNAENLIRQVIYGKTVNDEPVADIDHLHDIAFGYIVDAIQRYVISMKGVPEYARNYEVLNLVVINSIVTDLPEDETRGISGKNDEAVAKFVRENPLSEPVRHLFE